MENSNREALYGLVPEGLKTAPLNAVQYSPLIPGAERLEDRAEASLDAVTMLAPPGTVERRYALALALRALAPGGTITAMAPKLKGGARLGDELRAFGCALEESAKRHHRICVCVKPAAVSGLDEAIGAGAPRFVEALGLWSQPGLFNWDHPDPGSALLIEALPPLFGRGADFGCGFGLLARAVLNAPKVKEITLFDIDRRAMDAAARNIVDTRAKFRWSDLRRAGTSLTGLDFVVMNPPFHQGGGAEDQTLGQAFIRRAAESLRPGGVLWITANRHLPYEAVLKAAFKEVAPRADAQGYKVFEARK